MKHSMGLYVKPFESIKSGAKTVEVRLNDEKRRTVHIADTIEFTRLRDKDCKIHVFVEGLRVFPTFEEMYRAIPAKDLDCEGSTLQEMLDETYEIYTPDQDAKWGTLAISVKRQEV